MKDARFLVTGGAGFIGSHLVDRLVAEGHPVTVLDDFSTGLRRNTGAWPTERVRVLEGDVRDAATVARAAEGCRGIFHLAAIPSVTRSVERPLESHEANVTGTLHVLLSAREQKAKVVYAGSSSAYGDTPALPKREDMREDPLSPYAASKLAGELYLRAFARVYGLRTVVARFFNVFGPRQRPDSPYSGVIAKFCWCYLHGEAPRIEGDGEQTRDFTFVTDTVDGVYRAMMSDVPPGSLFNVATGQRTSINTLAATLKRLCGSQLDPVRTAPRTGDVKHSLADITRAGQHLGYAATVSFAEGLQRTLDWYRKGDS
jgi:nucleoside-diphosphate-sugar epimerase